MPKTALGTAKIVVLALDVLAFDELGFPIHDDHGSTLSAVNETGVRIFICLESWFPIPSENDLGFIELQHSDHLPMLAFIRLPIPLEFAVVEGIREDFVERREVQGFGIGIQTRARLGQTTLDGFLPYLRNGICLAQKLIPHHTNESEALRVFFDYLSAFHSGIVAHVSE